MGRKGLIERDTNVPSPHRCLPYCHTHTYTYTHPYTHADDEGCKLIMAVYQGGQRKKERVSIQDTL